MVSTDEELMERFLAGDGEAFGLLAGRYHAPIYQLAMRFLGRKEDAEEIRQEALLRAFSHARRFRAEDGRFRSWIYRIAVNLCRDRNRRRRRLHWLSLGELSDAGVEIPAEGSTRADAATAERELVAGVRRALLRLPEEQRTVLVLKEMEGFTFREIAHILGCPESTVKSRLYRGLLALRAGFPGAMDAGGASGSAAAHPAA